MAKYTAQIEIPNIMFEDAFAMYTALIKPEMGFFRRSHLYISGVQDFKKQTVVSLSETRKTSSRRIKLFGPPALEVEADNGFTDTELALPFWKERAKYFHAELTSKSGIGNPKYRRELTYHAKNALGDVPPRRLVIHANDNDALEEMRASIYAKFR